MMQGRTIWITGAAGRMGTALRNCIKENYECKLVTTDLDVDITDMAAVDRAADIYRPAVIINCASVSDAEFCENNMVQAFRVNALGARNLATASRRINAKLIQLSTDDVFEGQTIERLTEFDTPMPVSVYGKSKLAGENYVRELNPKHLIVRSSWVYGTAKNDYFEFVDRMGSTGTTFEAPVDRVSTPTSARELAGFILSLIDKAEYGIFHASSEGTCSRYEYAREILALRGYDTALVKACRSREDGLVSSTHLENLMMKMTGLYEMPEWEDDLSRYVASLAPRAGKEDER